MIPRNSNVNTAPTAGSRRIQLESINVPVNIVEGTFAGTQGYIELKFKNLNAATRVWHNIPQFHKLIKENHAETLEVFVKKIEQTKNMIQGRVKAILSVYIVDENNLKAETRNLVEYCYSAACRNPIQGNEVEEYKKTTRVYEFDVDSGKEFFIDRNLLEEHNNDLEKVAAELNFLLDYFVFCTFTNLESKLNEFNRDTYGYTYSAWKFITSGKSAGKYILNPINSQESLILPYAEGKYGYCSYDTQFIFQGKPIQEENEFGKMLGLYLTPNDYQRRYQILKDNPGEVKTDIVDTIDTGAVQIQTQVDQDGHELPF